MPDSFGLTILLFVLLSFVVAFLKGRLKDKCLLDFNDDLITLSTEDGKTIWGKLCVEKTGFELTYGSPHEDDDGHIETSYILYKSEYTIIRVLIRYLHELDDVSRSRREKSLAKTYHPNLFRRWLRKLNNVFKTVNDSVMDVINLLIGQVKKSTSYGALIGQHEKYTQGIRQEMIHHWGNAYEPLLEKHIGSRVVIEVELPQSSFEFSGILKDYTPEFIEVMDVEYRTSETAEPRRADIIVPRKYGIVRHLGE